jgi:hypothetical protein
MNSERYYRETNKYLDGIATQDHVAMFYRNRDRDIQESQLKKGQKDFEYWTFKYRCNVCGTLYDNSFIIHRLYDYYENKDNCHIYKIICKDCKNIK